MKKRLFFLAPFTLILFAGMQTKTSSPFLKSTANVERPTGRIIMNENSTPIIPFSPPTQLPNPGLYFYSHNAKSTSGLISGFNQNRMPEPCDSTIENCSFDTRGYIFSEADIIKTDRIYYGKYDPPDTIPGFYDVSYSADNPDQIIDDYENDEGFAGCGSDGCSKVGTDAYYRVYYPLHDYNACKLKVIFLFHAGGYSDCSGPNYEDTLCRSFARKGLVTVLVEYRQGRIKDLSDGGKYTSDQQMLAVYRAFQDAKGALRSFIYKQADIVNPVPYLVDTNNIFVA